MEISTYGSELVAAGIAVEITIAYSYKLRMLGVTIIGMSLLYGVITNASILDSNNKKRHCACVYHFIREVSTAVVISFIYK